MTLPGPEGLCCWRVAGVAEAHSDWADLFDGHADCCILLSLTPAEVAAGWVAETQ